MRAINHALTGAVIGAAVHNPWVAVSAAFVSHFICDVIPHYGTGENHVEATESFKKLLIADALLCGLLVLVLAMLQPVQWLLAAVCAFVAASPDFWSIKRFVYARQGKTYYAGRIARFTGAIQWFERPAGLYIELIWAVAALFLLINVR